MTVATIDAAQLKRVLADGGEFALLDVSEEGQFGLGHPFLAVNLPYSRLEREILRLVPRRSCRVILVDQGDGVAARAARRLAALGYGDVSIVAGGCAAWAQSGQQLFIGVNVPSKAFGEAVEHEFHTPSIAAEELDRLFRSNADVILLDPRPVEEYARGHVPHAVCCPGGELVYRFVDLVPSPEMLVVVSCAGRTRGIIGAQSLINAGIADRVKVLDGGTQGWRLHGLELESGASALYAPVSDVAIAASREKAAAIEARFAIVRIDHAALAGWRAESDRRTTYLLDVRTPEEFVFGHLEGAVSAPGGQLIQALDQWVATHNARLVLADDTGIRAVIAAHWLKQMGWKVAVLDRALENQVLDTGPMPQATPELVPQLATISAREAARWIDEDAAILSLGPSLAFRQAHPKGARWANRARLDRLPPTLLGRDRVVLFTEDAATAKLAAIDLKELSTARVAAVEGGLAAWQAAGMPVEASPQSPPDAERIDYLFWAHDRHSGNHAAMRQYLDWETQLLNQIEKDGGAPYAIRATHARN